MKTTRREFLATAAAAPLASPILLGMQDKAGTKAPVLGQGRFTYEALHDWGTLPPQIKYGNTHGVVQDSQGQIYVHHTVYADSESADSMVVFDGKGRFVRSWGRQFRGVAHGLLIRKEAGTEFLYLTVNATNPRLTPQPEMQAVVVKTTLAGEIVWKIQGPPPIDQYKPSADGKPAPYNPTNIAIAPNGDIYVGDGYGSYYVNQYTSKGDYIRTFGGKGSEAGLLGGAARHLGRHARPRPSWWSPTAETTVCNGSRWTARISISFPGSACRATSTSRTAPWSFRTCMVA